MAALVDGALIIGAFLATASGGHDQNAAFAGGKNC
jgi:hypothetical protein